MPNNNVGGVSVSVRLDDRDALKQLDALKAKIAKLNASLQEKRTQRDTIAQQMDQAEAAAERARQKVQKLQAALASAAPGDKAGIRTQLTAANADLREQTRNMDKLNNQYQKLDAEIATGETSLESMTGQTALLEQQIAASNSTMAKLESAANKAAKKIEKAVDRVGRMIRRVFVFALITRALRGLREYLGSVLMSVPEFSASLGQLKSALLTLAQPIMEIVIPALVRLLQIITQVITAIATLVSRIFGKTYSESQAAASALYDQAKAYKEIGGAAKKAAKSLAAFDELNILSNNSGSGGGASATAGTPAFDISEMDDSQLRKILDIVEAIGAALLAWKIGSALGLGLTGIIGLAMLLYSTIQFVKEYLETWDEGITWDHLKDLFAWLAVAAAGAYLAFGAMGAGIVMILGGIAIAILAVKDAWTNGVTWENMAALLGGIAVAALGAYLAFGAVAAGIVLVIGGIAMLVVGIKDVMENGLNLKNGLLVIAGILATGLGISLIVGSWIPMLIAAIVAVVAAITMVGGTFEQIVRAVKRILSGLITFITGVFTGDWEKAWEGLKDIFYGIINVILGLVGGLVNVLIKGLNWLISQMNKISFDVPEWVPGIGGKHVGVNINQIPEWQVPELASGAVIPPNREFLAVLGDQTSGTNIEAPLDTIVAAFRQALGERGGGANRTIILQVDKHELGRVTFDAYNAESQRIGMRLGGNRA